MDNAEMKSLRLHGIVFNPALNDGQNGKLRCEANQWVLDKHGHVTDIKHRLEAGDIESALTHLRERATVIMQLHVEPKK
jgi:hypothetical protein